MCELCYTQQHNDDSLHRKKTPLFQLLKRKLKAPSATDAQSAETIKADDSSTAAERLPDGQ
jgi:hypothetical protein